MLAYLENDIELCRPSSLHICDGSDEENRQLIRLMVAQHILQPLTKYENWYTVLPHRK